jgi:O-antigen/teichoic acid export membrane protein
MGLYSRLVRNTLMAIIVNYWTIVLAFFLSPYLIRKMGGQGYGVWVLVASFSVASGYLSLLDPGIQGAAVKFIAQHRATGEEERLRKTIWTSFFFFLFLGLVSSALLSLFGVFFATEVFNVPDELHAAIRGLFYLLAIQSLFDSCKLTWVAVYSGLERYDLLRLMQIGFSAVAAALMVLFLTLGYDITFAGLANLLASVLSFFVLAWGLRRLLPSIWTIPRDWRWEDVKPLFRLGTRLFGFRVTGVVFRQIDKSIIPILLISTLLTPYSVANYFYQVSQSAASFVASNFVPIASSLAALNSETQLKDVFLRGTRFTLAFTFPTAMVGIWLTEPAVTYWVGQELIQAVPLARILLITSFFAATGAVGFNMMIGMGRIKPLLIINMSSLMLKVFFSLTLTKIMGLSGAMIATLLAHLAVWYPYNHLYLKTLRVSWLEYLQKTMLKPYLVAGVLLALIWLIDPFIKPTNLRETIAVGGGAIAFYLGIFFMVGLDDLERKKLQLWLSPAIRNYRR